MTKTEINRAVAEKVMGWKYYKSPGYPAYFKKDKKNIDRVFVADWNPAERIDHAMMVMEKFDSWRVWKSGGKYAAEFLSVGYKCCLGDTAPMAICLASLAALKAKEGENE